MYTSLLQSNPEDELADEEVSELKANRGRTQKPSSARYSPFRDGTDSSLKTFLKCFVFCLAIWGMFDLSRRAVQTWRSKMAMGIEDAIFYCKHDCGNSPAEAFAKGCIYDVLENRLTRPECVNADLNREFGQLGRGTNGSHRYGFVEDGGIRDIEVTELVQVIKPGLIVWESTWWHLTHCIFMYRKAVLSRFDGVLLSMNRTEQEKHDHHCGRMLVNFLSKGPEVDEYSGWTVFGN